MLVAACGGEAAVPRGFGLRLLVVDEDGTTPLATATASLADADLNANAAGLITLDGLGGPVVALVGAPGHLGEVVPIGWRDADGEIVVRLLGDGGGRRVVLHTGGDVMFGRRYETPASEDATPLIPVEDPAGGAASVVRRLGRVFGAADVSLVNLETVLTEKRDEESYPGKRFILRSRPETVGGLLALGVDGVGLANNHARDFLDEGIAETIDALDGVGLPHTGATATGAGDAPPLMLEANGLRIAVLAWTTVNGSFVNDAYPNDGVPVPSGTPSSEAWQYQARAWGWDGTTWDVPELDRRIGGAWRLYDAEEPSLDDAEGAGAWASLVDVYPELQDWVSRRGHGGAASFSSSAVRDAIEAVRGDTDLVVVQLHAGFQFQEASSDGVRTAARAAIDAGADLVIGHHPHVLEGFDFYKGKLIAYSLGNFVFDQDFLSTFDSAFLRTVWDGNVLVEARVVPVELAGYQPLVATDEAADTILGRLWERSQLPTVADRDADGDVRAFASTPDADTMPAHLVIERGTARIVPDAPAPTERALVLPAGAAVPLGARGLVDPRLGAVAGDDTLIGRDLFAWGRFEDELADDGAGGGTHWSLGGSHEVAHAEGGARGRGALRISRDDHNMSAAVTCPVARTPLLRHRIWGAAEAGSFPIDPAPTYSLLMMVRRKGEAYGAVSTRIYHFDDTNPTEDPESVSLAMIERELDVPDDGAWHQVEIALDDPSLAPDGDGNQAMACFVLEPPVEGDATLEVDDLRVIEWRPAAMMDPAWGLYSHARSATGGTATIRELGVQ